MDFKLTTLGTSAAGPVPGRWANLAAKLLLPMPPMPRMKTLLVRLSANA